MVASLVRSLRLGLLPLALVLVGCGGAGEATIGPEGGELELRGIKVVIPPGALGQSRDLKISPVDTDLSRGAYKQSGGAWLLEPTDLALKIPATVTLTKLKDVSKPVVLFKAADEMRVHTSAVSTSEEEAVSFIGAFGTVSAASGGDPLATIAEPALVATPSDADAGAPNANGFHVKVTPAGLAIVDVVLTAFDLRGENNRDLNGGAYCAFKLENVQGASIATGCTNGLTTATLSPSSSTIEFDVVPFLLDKVPTPVVVQVEVGSTDIANTLGFTAVKTSPCFYETCSGRGTCVEDGESAAHCECNEGYGPAEEGLECECIPQCAGRECGGDSCGGSCEPGCGEGFMCNNDAGSCEPVPDPTTGPDTTTTSGGTTTTSGGTTTTSGGTTSTTGGTTSTTGGTTGTTGTTTM